MKRLAAFLLLLAGCDDLPRDPDGTLERVRVERAFRVGLIADGEDRRGAGQARLLLARVGEAAGARPALTQGSADPLLIALEAGALDLVIGRFAADSPWSKRVTLTAPLARYPAEGGGEQEVAAALRNGENRWIMLVEREARAIGAGE